MNTPDMIPSVNVMTAGIIVFFALFLPVILTSIGMALKFLDFKSYICGFGVFMFSQLLLRAPIISALMTDESFKNFASSAAGLAFIGGISAAFVEDTAKYAVAGKFLKNDISYRTALSLGFGSLCCEFIFVLGFKYIGSLITMLVINSGSYSNTNLMSIDGTSQVIAEMSAMSPVSMIFELTARISKGMFFLCSGVMIMKGVQQKNIIYWLMSLLMHTLFNCILLLIPNAYAANSIALFVGFLFMMYAILAKDEFITIPRKRNGRNSAQRRKENKSYEIRPAYGNKLKNTYYENSGIEKVLRNKNEKNPPKRRIVHEENEEERDLMAEIAKIIVENNDILENSDLADKPSKNRKRSANITHDEEEENFYSPTQNVREIYRRNMRNTRNTKK